MRATSNKHKISIEIPDGYSVFSESERTKFNINENTVFMLINEDNQTISIDPDAEFNSEEEYDEIINANVEGIKEMGISIKEQRYLDVDERIFKIACSYCGNEALIYLTPFNNKVYSIGGKVGDSPDEIVIKLIRSMEVVEPNVFDEFRINNPRLMLESLDDAEGFATSNCKTSVIDGFPFSYKVERRNGIIRLVALFDFSSRFDIDESVAKDLEGALENKYGVNVYLQHLSLGEMILESKLPEVSSYDDLQDIMDNKVPAKFEVYTEVLKEVCEALQGAFDWKSESIHQVEYSRTAEDFEYSTEIKEKDGVDCWFEAKKEGVNLRGMVTEGPDGFRYLSVKVVVPYTSDKPILDTINELNENEIFKKMRLMAGLSEDGLMVTLNSPAYAPIHLGALVNIAYSIAETPILKEAIK